MVKRSPEPSELSALCPFAKAGLSTQYAHLIMAHQHGTSRQVLTKSQTYVAFGGRRNPIVKATRLH